MNLRREPENSFVDMGFSSIRAIRAVRVLAVQSLAVIREYTHELPSILTMRVLQQVQWIADA